MVRSFSIIGDVLVDFGLSGRLLIQRLLLFVLCDELSLQLHYGVLNSGARQVLYSTLWHGWRSIVETPLVCVCAHSLVVHAVWDGVVSVAASLSARALHLCEVSLANLAGALGLRRSCDEASLWATVALVLRHGPSRRHRAILY